MEIEWRACFGRTLYIQTVFIEYFYVITAFNFHCHAIPILNILTKIFIFRTKYCL